MIIERVRECFKNKKPIFGICLGHQIMAKAAGAKSLISPLALIVSFFSAFISGVFL